jgi:hypothetical protein
MIAIPGEEAPADPLADLRAEASLTDPNADFLLAPVRPDGEAPPSLLSEPGPGAAEPSLAMAHAGAHTRALEAAAKTGLQLGIMGQEN